MKNIKNNIFTILVEKSQNYKIPSNNPKLEYDIAKMGMMHAFGLINEVEFRRFFDKHGIGVYIKKYLKDNNQTSQYKGSNIKAFRSAIGDSHVIQVQLKPWLFKCIKEKCSEYKIKKESCRFSILEPSDVNLGMVLLQDRDFVSKVRKKAYKKKKLIDMPALSYKDIKKMVQKTVKSSKIKNYISYETWYRLRYIYSNPSVSLSRDIIEGKLRYHVIRTLYNRYPGLESFNHCIAIAKQTIDRRIINIRRDFEKDKRHFLIKDEEDGTYEAKIRSRPNEILNQIMVESDENDKFYQLIKDIKSELKDEPKWKKKAVKVIAGEDNSFFAYCREQHGKINPDKMEFQMSRKYWNHLSNYLDVGLKELYKFRVELAKMSGFNKYEIKRMKESW